MTHFAIVANGDFLVKEIITEALADKIVIALDGAADRLGALGFIPNIILGDFDSIQTDNIWGIQKSFSDIHDADLPYTGNFNVLVVPAKNQLLTDLDKAIQYCDAHAAESITILCALGARQDHHEGTIRLLQKAYRPNRFIQLHSESQTLQFAKDETLTIFGQAGDKCGVLAFPRAIMSSQGLEYEAKDLELVFGLSENICNALLREKAMLTISGEALVVMPGILQSQRQFMQLSPVQQLELLLRDAKSAVSQ